MNFFQSGNWLQFPKEILEALIRGELTKREIQVFLFIYEKCYLGRKASSGGTVLRTREISRSDIADRTGIHPVTVRKILRDLEAWGYIKVAQERSKHLKNRIVNNISIKPHGVKKTPETKKTPEVKLTPESGVKKTPDSGVKRTPDSGVKRTLWERLYFNDRGRFEGRKISLKPLFKTSLKRGLVDFIEYQVNFEGKGELLAKQYCKLEQKVGFDLLTKAEHFCSSEGYMCDLKQPTTLVKYLSRCIELNRVKFEDEVEAERKELIAGMEKIYQQFTEHLDAEDNETPPELTQSSIELLEKIGQNSQVTWDVFASTAHMVNKSQFTDNLLAIHEKNKKLFYGIYQ